MQVLRGLLPVGLVLVLELMAECLSLAVHGNHKILWCILAHQAHHCVEEPVDGGHIVTVLVLERIVHESEIGTVDLTVPVNYEYSSGGVSACI